MNSTLKTAQKNVDALTRQTNAVAKAHPSFYVGEAGAASSSKALDKLFSSQLGNAGMRSLPLTLLILTNTRSPAFKHAVAGLQTKAAGSGQVYGPLRVESNTSHTVARISVPIIGDGVNKTSTHALLTLRNQLLPETIATLAVSYAVTGDTAAAHDNNQQMRVSLPIVLVFVLTFAFLLSG